MKNKIGNDYSISGQSRLIVKITKGNKYSKVSKINSNVCRCMGSINPYNSAMQHLKGDSRQRTCSLN
jgi:hypothetical protein